MRRPLVIAALMVAVPSLAEEDAAMGKRVQELLHAHQADVYGCVANASGAAKGEMLVRVVVGESQQAAKAEVLKDSTGLPTLAGCLTAKLQKWDLTALAAASGDQVVFPLVFKPEPLKKGEKRVLVPMAAQDASGPQRFLIDEDTVGEAPLATMDLLSLAGNQSTPAKARHDDEEEVVLYVVEGSFKSGTETLVAGDALWLGAHTDRPALTPLDKRPLKLLEIRAHGEGTGQKVLHAEEHKAYPIAGTKAGARLLLDGSGAKLAVDDIETEAGVIIPLHKHASQDEELFFLSGRSSTTIGKQTFETAAGDAVRIPANVAHSMKALEHLRVIQVYAPGGPEQRFKQSAGDDGTGGKSKKHKARASE